MTDILLRGEQAGVVTLTLNRPAARNALSLTLMAALEQALDGIDADETTRVVVIARRGAGLLRRARSAGGPRHGAGCRRIARCSPPAPA